MDFLFLCNNFLSKLSTNRRSMNFRLIFFFFSTAVCAYKSSFTPSNISLMFCLHETNKQTKPQRTKQKKPTKQTNHCCFHLNQTPMVRNATVHLAVEMCAVQKFIPFLSPCRLTYINYSRSYKIHTWLLPPPCPVTYVSLSLISPIHSLWQNCSRDDFTHTQCCVRRIAIYN